MEIQESQLVEQALAGDNDALTALLGTASPQIRARLIPKIRPVMRSMLDIDDVLQVTYMEVFQRIGQFENKGEGAFLAWTTRIAENNLLDAVRSLERAKRPPAHMRLQAREESTVALYDRLMMTTTTPSRHAADAEAHQMVESTLQLMPEDYAKVIELYELRGQTVAEVANELGRSEGAVYMLRARAMDRLRELLTH